MAVTFNLQFYYSVLEPSSWRLKGPKIRPTSPTGVHNYYYDCNPTQTRRGRASEQTCRGVRLLNEVDDATEALLRGAARQGGTAIAARAIAAATTALRRTLINNDFFDNLTVLGARRVRTAFVHDGVALDGRDHVSVLRVRPASGEAA